MTRSELKSLSKSQISGKIGILFLITLVVSVIGMACNVVPMIGSLAYFVFVGPAFTFAMTTIYLQITDNAPITFNTAFCGFSKFWVSFKATFLTNLFIFLWSMLFLIPGLIKSFSYSQTRYIIAENPEIGALEAITRSRRMMDGYKTAYFVMHLSFIGWHLLAFLTFGLLYIWLLPYIEACNANFYRCVKAASDEFYAESAPSGYDYTKDTSFATYSHTADYAGSAASDYAGSSSKPISDSSYFSKPSDL